MKYSNGFWSALFHEKWMVETGSEHFSYVRKNTEVSVSYSDIYEFSMQKGIVWDSLTIVVSGQSSTRIDGLRSKTAKKLATDITHRVKKYLVGQLLKQLHSLMEEKRYLAHADIRRWIQNHIVERDGVYFLAHADIRRRIRNAPDIAKTLANSFFSTDDLPHELQKLIRPFTDLVAPGSPKLKARNEEFVEWALRFYNDLFSKLEKYPLTDEQRRSAVINEDRNLLIAAAGSGKSSTIIAKAAYLVESGLAQTSDILVLAYNKAAQTEIDERLKNLKGTVANFNRSIKAKTFHSLGQEIIANVEGEKPAISKLAEAQKTHLAKLFIELIEELIENNSTFAMKWRSFQTLYKVPYTDLNSIDGTKPQLRLLTLDGKEVKSMEELRICNWLMINGIAYEYERPYEHRTADVDHRQYYPDFYYPEAGFTCWLPRFPRQYYPDFYYPEADTLGGALYHEHFALNAHGHAPKTFHNYDEGVAWKRRIHSEKNTKLIETLSAHVQDGSVFDRLSEQLEGYGVSRNPLDETQLDTLVRRNFDLKTDTELFTTFLRHFKSNNSTMEQVRQKADGNSDPARSRLFLDLFEVIFDAYQSRLCDAQEIDFEDQIHKACDYIEAGKFRHAFKYILVDEFQDMSQDKKRMIHSLIDQDEDAKLFAVGDDWQSIYGFAGVNIDIMTHFADHFGTTYRSTLTRFRTH